MSEPPRIVRPDPPPTPAGLELLLLPWPPVPPAAVREPNVDVAPVLPVPPVPAESRRLPPAPPVPTVTLTVPLIETPVETVTFPPPLAATVNAVSPLRRAKCKRASETLNLPTRMIITVATSGQGWVMTTLGLNNIPTDTKNKTANASRKGSVSSAARWLSCDSLKIMPAKNAPRANETPNRAAAPKATTMAMASTASRNNSRDPVLAT